LEKIIDTYEMLGESLPQLMKYEDLFRSNSYMQCTLEYVYEDILDFHRGALKVFKHKGILPFL